MVERSFCEALAGDFSGVGFMLGQPDKPRHAIATPAKWNRPIRMIERDRSEKAMMFGFRGCTDRGIVTLHHDCG